MHAKGTNPNGLGRWPFVTRQEKTGSFIFIISAYRVSQKSPTSTGVKTAYMQQHQALSQHTISHPPPPQWNPTDSSF